MLKFDSVERLRKLKSVIMWISWIAAIVSAIVCFAISCDMFRNGGWVFFGGILAGAVIVGTGYLSALMIDAKADSIELLEMINNNLETLNTKAETSGKTLQETVELLKKANPTSSQE